MAYQIPTERIDLPSRGLIYPTDHPLAQGFVEIRIPTAKEEDILTNPNYLKQNIAIDKFLESITITKFDYDDMIVGDKGAVELAGRILGYGKNYSFSIGGERATVDLSTMKETVLDETMITRGVNEFKFTLPLSGASLIFKLLTGKDQKAMEEEIKGMKKSFPNYSADTTMLFYHSIVEINGSRSVKDIRDFVNNGLLLQDTKALKKEMIRVAPGYEWKADGVTESGEVLEGLSIPYTVDFFWPRD